MRLGTKVCIFLGVRFCVGDEDCDGAGCVDLRVIDWVGHITNLGEFFLLMHSFLPMSNCITISCC